MTHENIGEVIFGHGRGISSDIQQPFIRSRTGLEIVREAYGIEPNSDASLELVDGVDVPLTTLNAVGELALVGQELMVARHGRAYPVFTPVSVERGISHLGYNSGDHTEEFAQHAGFLGEHIGFTDLERKIDRLVAAWHDGDQTVAITGGPRLGKDERESAEMVVRELRNRGLPTDIALTVAEGILATWPATDASGRPIGQWATAHDDYATDAARRAAYVAATCDLTGIFSPRGPLMGSYLDAQRQGLAPDKTPTLGEYGQFVRGQIGFLAMHTFPIDEANELFTANRGAAVRHTERKLAAWEQGQYQGSETDFWDNTILAMDRAFLKAHRPINHRP